MMTGGKVIDADSLQRIQLNARHKEAIRPVIVAGETIIRSDPSPHPFLDPVIARADFQAAAVERLCGQCPDCGDCPIAGDPNAQYRCLKLRRMMP